MEAAVVAVPSELADPRSSGRADRDRPFTRDRFGGQVDPQPRRQVSSC